MPARIYALAKELNVDSKELVDLVRRSELPERDRPWQASLMRRRRRSETILQAPVRHPPLHLPRLLLVPFATQFPRNANQSRSRLAVAVVHGRVNQLLQQKSKSHLPSRFLQSQSNLKPFPPPERVAWQLG